jgi:GNAT superfamily N-acetyltransferase
MEIIFKRLTECNITDIITAWNRGFEGYFVQIEMTPEAFFQRIVNEGLSLNLSLLGYDGEKPVAVVVNGVRTIDGKKTAWNGGTGVAPEYRGKGVSKQLMEETLKIYEQEGVEVATLEAIKENERAIKLYERYGYQIVDAVAFLSGTHRSSGASFNAESIRPEQLPHLDYYKENIPWQCQWQSVRAGEAQIFYGSEGNPLGYSLFRRVWNGQGELERVIIYQIEIFGEVAWGLLEEILNHLSAGAVGPVSLMTVNTSLSNPAIQLLLENGFKVATEQVQMVKKL